MNRKERRKAAALHGQPEPAVPRAAGATASSGSGPAADAAAYCRTAFADLERKRFAEAAEGFRKAIAARPEMARAHNGLGLALRAQGKPSDAAACYERAIACDPANAAAYNNLGNALRDQNRLADAVAQYRRAIDISPDHARAHGNLGLALHRLRRFGDAATHFRRAAELEPHNADAHNNLGNALHAQGKLEEAADAYRRALAERPDFAAAHKNLGNCLRELGDLEGALAQFQDALRLRPDYAEAYSGLGNVLKTGGRLEEARRAHEKAVELAPKNGMLHQQLAESKHFSAGDPQIAQMEALVCDEAIPETGRLALHFALGKAYADAGDDDRSFRHYLQGNALKRRQIPYDETSMLALLAGIERIFTREMMEARAGQGFPDPAPVFIIGMPRSGTSLVEQILASHPKVHGAGELKLFSEAAAGCKTAGGRPLRFPDEAEALSAQQLQEIGKAYVEGIRKLAPSSDRVTDKMPWNFRYAGLIHLSLPRAKIIHVRRDPLDTCISCFTKLFTRGQPYSYDLGELGRYYKAYEKLMAHWRAALPSGVMLEVHYEDLAADLDGVARRLVAHCGLAWNDTCLSFHEHDRPVRTASAAQVRRPIYRSSIARWRAYREHLAPLTAALGIDIGNL